MRIQVLHDGGSNSYKFVDRLLREVRASIKIDNKWSRVDTVYDSLGRIEKKSEPNFSGSSWYWDRDRL